MYLDILVFEAGFIALHVRCLPASMCGKVSETDH